MTEINNDATRIIQRIIQIPISEGNCEQVYGAIIAGRSQLIPNQILVDKLLELAAFHTSQDRIEIGIGVLEDARQLDSSNYSVIYHLSQLMQKYWDRHLNELCETDLVWLSEYLYRVDSSISESEMYYAIKEKLPGLYRLINKVSKTRLHVKNYPETKHTFFLSQLSTKQYEDLSPDERKQRAAKILGKRLKKLYREDCQNPKPEVTDSPDAKSK